MNGYLPLFGAIGLTVAAQLLLKFAATRTYSGFRRVCNGYNALAYSLLLVVTVLLVKALQSLPLAIATAWISLTYLLVVVASVVIFREGRLKSKLLACSLIMAGVLMFEAPQLQEGFKLLG